MSRSYIFESDHAEKYGIEAAILLHHIRYWIEFNHAEGKNRKENRTWMFHSYRALAAHFPFWSEDCIYRILKKLCTDDGPLIKGDFNSNPYIKTKWYAFKNEDEWLRPKIKESFTLREIAESTPQTENDYAETRAPLREIAECIKDKEKDKEEKEKRDKSLLKKKTKTIEEKFERDKEVFTTEREHKKLIERFGSDQKVKEVYFEISRWKTAKGVGNRDDYRTALNWQKNAEVKKTPVVEKNEPEKIASADITLWRLMRSDETKSQPEKTLTKEKYEAYKRWKSENPV